MPVREGLPSGPCPQHRNDKTVVIGKGDLLLCQACDTECRRLFDENKKTIESKSSAVKQAANAADDTSRKMKSTRSSSTRAVLASASSEQSGGTNVTVLPAATESCASSSAPLASLTSVIVNDEIAEIAAPTLLFPDRPSIESNRTDVKVIINELLAYAMFYRDKSTSADLHKIIVNFYLPSEINVSKTAVINQFSDYLDGCQYKTARRQSSARSAHDAEVEDILGMLELLDNYNVLVSVQFAAVALDRMPHYGPNEINICAVVDKQVHLDKELLQLNKKVVDSLANNRVATICAVEDQLKILSDKMPSPAQ